MTEMKTKLRILMGDYFLSVFLGRIGNRQSGEFFEI